MSTFDSPRSPDLAWSPVAARNEKTTLAAARIAYLDGIRALAITSVLVVHWWYHRLPGGAGGYLGVDVFFVLSGYIITTMLWRARDQDRSLRSSWTSFIYRRAWRLYPALLGLLVGGIIIYAAVPNAPLTARQVAGHALVSAFQLYPLWFQAPREPFVQAWSLAIEWYFYLLWPIALLYCKRRGIGPRTMAKAITGFAVVIYLASLPMEAQWFYASPPPRFAELLSGAAVAMYLISLRPGQPFSIGRAPRAVFGPLAIGSIVLYVMLGPGAFSLAFRFIGVPIAVLATSYLILAGANGARDTIVRLLGLRPMAFLGRISYSLYLWHLIVTGLVRKNAFGLPAPIVAVLELAATFALTWASYAILERPFTKPRAEAFLPATAAP